MYSFLPVQEARKATNGRGTKLRCRQYVAVLFCSVLTAVLATWPYSQASRQSPAARCCPPAAPCARGGYHNHGIGSWCQVPRGGVLDDIQGVWRYRYHSPEKNVAFSIRAPLKTEPTPHLEREGGRRLSLHRVLRQVQGCAARASAAKGQGCAAM